MDNLNLALTKFDSYNQQDPNSIIWDGQSYPREYFLAIQLYDWLLRLSPKVSQELLLASRAQHIGRWTIPRGSYPPGRESYLRWRSDLAQFHARKAAELMTEAGYEHDTIARVQQIILKKKIKADSEVQIMENALCLVFLQFQYEEFHPLHSEEKVITILRKSLLKMDAAGHEAALGLNYSEQGLQYIKKALALIHCNRE